MRSLMYSAVAVFALLAFATLVATPLDAQTLTQRFEIRVKGDSPVKRVKGNSAWAYEDSGFFHIGLDGKDGGHAVSLDINRVGNQKPNVGVYRIGNSSLSGFRAKLEVSNGNTTVVHSGSGKLEIVKAIPTAIKGRFEFESDASSGDPEVTVSGNFLAKVRKKKK